MIAPPALPPEATLAAVAPSGPFEREEFEAGVARLSDLKVRYAPELWTRRQGFFAGTDRERSLELQSALDAPDLDGVIVARGGYGLGRIIDTIDLGTMRARPKWVVGFSDATVLHARLWRENIQSIHGPNVTTLSRATASQVRALMELLAGGAPPDLPLQTLRPGRAEGPLVGGNLTVLFAEAAAGRLHLPDGCLLFLEDVTETSYRVDRMLDALWTSTHLAKIAGLIWGEFTQCSPGKFGVPIESVIADFSRRFEVPVATGLPVGHGPNNLPLPLGRRARLSCTSTFDAGLEFIAVR